MNIQSIDFQWNETHSVFASEQYLRSMSDEYGWLGGIVDGQIYFVLPYIIQKKFIFRYLEFHTNTIYLKKDLSIGEEKLFLNKVVGFLKDKKIDFIKQPPTHVVFNTIPDQSVDAPFGSYVIELTKGEEELWKNVHSKHRNVIRRAEKNQVQIIRDKKYAMVAYNLLKQTMDRSNMGFYSCTEYQRIINDLGKNVEIFIAFKDNEPQGCAVFPYSSHSAYYLLGGSSDNPSLGAMNLLHWEAMKYFKSLGVEFYDFVGARIKPDEGSKLEGIQKFKSRFGATMKTGYLWKQPFCKWKYVAFDCLRKIKNRNQAGDVIDQENAKVLQRT